MSLIYEQFARVCSARRHQLALRALSEDVARTFEDLWADVVSMKAALHALDLPSRPTIVSTVGNCHGFVPLLVASLALDAGILLLDGDAAWPEVEATADRIDADVVIARGERLRESHSPLPCALAAMPRRSRQAESWRAAHEAQGLILKSTSGSTRLPKFVVSTEANLLSDGQQMIEGMTIGADDVMLAAVPLSHAYGLGVGVMPLLLQGSTIVMRDRFVPARLAQDVTDCGVTMMPGVPFIYDYLQRLGADAVASLAGLRLLVTAGAPVSFETLQFFKRTAGLKIHSLYGTSETGGICFDASEEVEEPVHVGHHMPHAKVTLVDSPGLMPGEGRVAVEGPAVAARYALADLDDDDVSSASCLSCFTGTGFLSGDVGRYDAGRLVLTGRVSHFVNVAGRKVQPQEVERAIATLPGVLQVNVFGAPCRTRGQILVACVRRDDKNVSAALVRSHCATQLTSHKIPRQIVFADEWPTDARGKTDRRALEALARAAAREMDDI